MLMRKIEGVSGLGKRAKIKVEICGEIHDAYVVVDTEYGTYHFVMIYVDDADASAFYVDCVMDNVKPDDVVKDVIDLFTKVQILTWEDLEDELGFGFNTTGA